MNDNRVGFVIFVVNIVDGICRLRLEIMTRFMRKALFLLQSRYTVDFIMKVLTELKLTSKLEKD